MSLCDMKKIFHLLVQVLKYFRHFICRIVLLYQWFIYIANMDILQQLVNFLLDITHFIITFSQIGHVLSQFECRSFSFGFHL